MNLFNLKRPKPSTYAPYSLRITMRLPGLDGPLMIEDRFYGSNAEELDAHLHLVSDEFYDYVSLLGERFYLMPAFFGMLEDPRSYTIIAGRYFVTFDVKEIRI